MERGERGSTEEHLTVTQFKVQQETARLEVLEAQTEKKEQLLQRIEQKTKVKKTQASTFEEIDSMGRKTFTGKVELTAQEASFLKEQAKRGISAAAVISDLKKKLEAARQDTRIWKDRYESLQAQTKEEPFNPGGGCLWTDKERLWIPKISNHRQKERPDRTSLPCTGF